MFAVRFLTTGGFKTCHPKTQQDLSKFPSLHTESALHCNNVIICTNHFLRCFSFCACVKQKPNTREDALRKKRKSSYCVFLAFVGNCASPRAWRLLKPCVNLLATWSSNLQSAFGQNKLGFKHIGRDPFPHPVVSE